MATTPLTAAGKKHDPKKYISAVLHIVVLLLSIYLVVSISIDTFKNVAFWKRPEFLKSQFWICIVFLLDFFIEFFMAKRKWHYIWTHFFFLIVSIPYLSIFHFLNWTFSPQITYLIQYIPLVRGGYALAIVVGWFTYNRATGLFFTYLFTLISTVYFASLVFYMFEHNINSMVVDYYSALWWASMDVTTVGSNIEAVTTIGRILSVLLAASGMMMFPIFTVYITNIIIQQRKDNAVLIPDPRLNQQQGDSQAPSTPASSETPAPTKNQEAGVTS